MKIVAFAASTSTQSINKKFVTAVVGKLENVEVEILDLNDFSLPLFSEDIERELGHPEAAARFLSKLSAADGIVVSFAEHNGLYSAAFKNLFDWCSRVGGKVYQNKPMLLLATSPGARGGKSVLEYAQQATPRFGGEVCGAISLPSFHDNFDVEKGMVKDQRVREQIDLGISALLDLCKKG